MSALSNSDEWMTPRAVFNACSAHYGPFDLDAAAAPWNAQCEKFLTKKQNAFRQEWRGRVWLNCPYSRGNLIKWTALARIKVETRAVQLVCMLVPAYTSELWWHRNVMAPGRGRSSLLRVDRGGIGTGWRATYADLVVEVVFVAGRLRFRHETGVADSARHPSTVVVFSRRGLLT